MTTSATHQNIPPRARFVALWGTPNDVEEFERHYRDTHVPLAAQLPGLRRYTLGRNVSAGQRGEPYYLIAELDWDDMDALHAAFSSEAGRRTGADAAALAELAPLRSMVYELTEAACTIPNDNEDGAERS